MHSTRGMPIAAVTPWASMLLTALALTACADAPVTPDASGVPSRSVASPSLNADRSDRPGAVYTLTNAAGGNGVIAFRPGPDGALTPLGTVATGGRGSGGDIDPLESQYAIVLTEEHDALFAVDAGSDRVSSFRVGAEGALTLTGTVLSDGTRPNSLAVHGHLLYALNSGDNTLTVGSAGAR